MSLKQKGMTSWLLVKELESTLAKARVLSPVKGNSTTEWSDISQIASLSVQSVVSFAWCKTTQMIRPTRSFLMRQQAYARRGIEETEVEERNWRGPEDQASIVFKIISWPLVESCDHYVHLVLKPETLI